MRLRRLDAFVLGKLVAEMGSLLPCGHWLRIGSPTRELQAYDSTSAVNIVKSVFLFIIAGILEIGGGYLVWKGVREKLRPAITIPLGCIILAAYGLVVTLQPLESFGRTFAVYGGFFIVLSYLWAYIFDGTSVDTGDIVGSAIALSGVCVAWFWPR